jgi:hypothetical protein
MRDLAMDQRETLTSVGDSHTESRWSADFPAVSSDSQAPAPTPEDIQPLEVLPELAPSVVFTTAAVDSEEEAWSGGDPGTPEDARQDSAAAFPLRRRLLFAALMSPLLLAMLLSTLSQLGFAWWLIERVPPPQRGGIDDLINSHLVQILLQQQELEQPWQTSCLQVWRQRHLRELLA